MENKFDPAESLKENQSSDTHTQDSNDQGDISISDGDIFKSIYKAQRDENKKVIKADGSGDVKTDAQKDSVSQPEKKKDVDENKGNNEKTKKLSDDQLKIIFIFIIILTVAIFLASVLFLFLGKYINDDSQQPVTDNSVQEDLNKSIVLSSPFNYTQTYNCEFPEGIQEKYKDLYAQNSDFVGWLNVPGTSIDTPVYQTSNNTYYLKHDNYDAYNKYGVPFLDSSCGVKTLSRNSTIYGHNFDNKLIFDEIHNYQDLEYYKKYPVIEYNTLYNDYKWKVIAAFHTNGSSEGDNGYLFYYIASNMSDDHFMEFYDELMQRSYIHTGVDVEPQDKILTLSTCTYFFDRNGSLENARFVLVARLVREGESEDVDTSKATANENVRYPQLYYDVFGGTNPYKNASKWYAE